MLFAETHVVHEQPVTLLAKWSFTYSEIWTFRQYLFISALSQKNPFQTGLDMVWVRASWVPALENSFSWHLFPSSFLLLSGCCTSAFPTPVKLYFADTSPNQGINVLGFAFMPWLFFPLWNFLWGATRATGRMWPSGMDAWEFSPSKIEIYDPVTWTFSFQVFLVSNWSAGNHIDVKCSRRSVYVISNDRILFSYIHLRF